MVETWLVDSSEADCSPRQILESKRWGQLGRRILRVRERTFHLLCRYMLGVRSRVMDDGGVGQASCDSFLFELVSILFCFYKAFDLLQKSSQMFLINSASDCQVIFEVFRQPDCHNTNLKSFTFPIHLNIVC